MMSAEAHAASAEKGSPSEAIENKIKPFSILVKGAVHKYSEQA
jgi:hypothetical protein